VGSIRAKWLKYTGYARLVFKLIKQVLSLTNALVANCSKNLYKKEDHLAADMHPTTFLFHLMHRSLCAIRYVDLSVWKKRLAWYTARKCAAALLNVLPREPKPPQTIATLARLNLKLCVDQLLLRAPHAWQKDDALVPEVSVVIESSQTQRGTHENTQADALTASLDSGHESRAAATRNVVIVDRFSQAVLPWQLDTGEQMQKLYDATLRDLHAIGQLRTASRAAPVCDWHAIREQFISPIASVLAYVRSLLDATDLAQLDMSKSKSLLVTASVNDANKRPSEALLLKILGGAVALQRSSIKLHLIDREVEQAKADIDGAVEPICASHALLHQRRLPMAQRVVALSVRGVEEETQLLEAELQLLLGELQANDGPACEPAQLPTSLPADEQPDGEQPNNEQQDEDKQLSDSDDEDRLEAGSLDANASEASDQCRSASVPVERSSGKYNDVRPSRPALMRRHTRALSRSANFALSITSDDLDAVDSASARPVAPDTDRAATPGTDAVFSSKAYWRTSRALEPSAATLRRLVTLGVLEPGAPAPSRRDELSDRINQQRGRLLVKKEMLVKKSILLQEASRRSAPQQLASVDGEAESTGKSARATHERLLASQDDRKARAKHERLVEEQEDAVRRLEAWRYATDTSRLTMIEAATKEDAPLLAAAEALTTKKQVVQQSDAAATAGSPAAAVVADVKDPFSRPLEAPLDDAVEAFLSNQLTRIEEQLIESEAILTLLDRGKELLEPLTRLEDEATFLKGERAATVKQAASDWQVLSSLLTLADAIGPDVERWMADQIKRLGLVGLRRYRPGQRLLCCCKPPGTDSVKWLDVEVTQSPPEIWSAVHWLKRTASTLGGVAAVEFSLPLSPFNHAPAMISGSFTAASFNQLWKVHCRTMRNRHATITDALSGRRLDTLLHCVAIELQIDQHDNIDREVVGKDVVVNDVTALSKFFKERHGRRLVGDAAPRLSGCVLLTAEPAAGKSCLMSQLVMQFLPSWMRTQPLAEENFDVSWEPKREELLPIFIRVQDLQKRLLDDEEHFNSKWNWVDAYAHSQSKLGAVFVLTDIRMPCSQVPA
jgi:hypothetical protein